MTFDVHFLDAGRYAEKPADPKYPDGTWVNLSENAIQVSCTRGLPYPAPRCGSYVIRCRVCGKTVAISVAGRADDPRRVTIPCGPKGKN